MHGLGARPSIPDQRDFIYRPTVLRPNLLMEIDLRTDGPLVWDQGELGSCVPHGVLGAVNYAEKYESNTVLSPSALFTYYVGREIEGTVDYDSGLYVRDGIKAVNSAGVATRWDWQYDISRFTEKPPAKAYQEATLERAIEYSRVTSLDMVNVALQEKLPVVFGVTVFDSFFYVGSDGMVPTPSGTERPAGGHCMLIVGWRPQDNRFIVRNSWGTGWGDEGFCYMESRYLDPYNPWAFASDFWTIKKVS